MQKMFGEYEQKFPQARALYLYMYTHPGKKLNFMGNELGQLREWTEEQEQDWDILKFPIHDAFYHYMHDLNQLYFRLQFFARIGHKLITGIVLSTIPHPATAIDHIQRVFVYHNPPGSLHSSLPTIFHPPRKAWNGIIQTYRSVKMFAPQINQTNRSLPLYSNASKECE